MERSRKAKATLESLVFSTPEQRLLRFLLTESSTSFTPRVLSSRLKGIRGLGGTEGINKVLKLFQSLGLVQFLDNNRAVSLFNDSLSVRLMKVLSSVCDLEDLKATLEPVSTRGILFGSRAEGTARSDSDYDLFVVSETPDEVLKIVDRHPMGRKIDPLVWNDFDYLGIEKRDRALSQKLSQGIVMWGTAW